MTNFLSLNSKVVPIEEKTIIASFDYKNASFIYIIKACIYSFLMMQRKFGSYTKEVYPL